MARSTVLFSALFAMLFLSVAEAQQRQRGQQGGQDTDLQLLQNEAVQKDLSLNEQQNGKLRELLVAYRKDAAEIPQLSRQDLQDLAPEARRAKQQENREALTKVQEKYGKQLGEILEAAQVERLGQIRLQVAGAAAVLEREVAEKLGLTREKRQEIQTALQELNQAGRQGGERPTAEQRANLREKLEAKVKELLSEEQLAKLNELKGKAFDVSQLEQRGPRRRNTDNNN